MALPVSTIAFSASLIVFAVALVRLLRGLIDISDKLDRRLGQTIERLGDAEDRLGRQIAETAYGEVIAEAKASGCGVRLS